ncbi:hypothetical protein [Haloechinothrix salitolerans]|uniref:Uncharacterized protein n=1 Tax=Haloechinothrix salitolerans TaxID=926830 RepID=A0ABW2BS74_9PSEU
MVKRYLGAVLAAFVVGCIGPLTVGSAQADEEPEDGSSLLGSVTATLGALTGGDADAAPDADAVPDVDVPSPAPGEPTPGDQPPGPAPAPPGPESAEPEGPSTDPAPDADGSGVIGAVTTTVSRLADAPRSLLTGSAGDDAPTPGMPTPDVPAQPDVPSPDVPQPPTHTPPPQPEPERPDGPSADLPGDPDTPAGPPADTPAGPPVNAASTLPDFGQSGVTEVEHSAPGADQQSITQPDIAAPDRSEPGRQQRDVPGFPVPADSAGGNTAEQGEAAAEPPEEDVRAETISLKHVTRTPFVVAIALLTAVGAVTVRRVITAR